MYVYIYIYICSPPWNTQVFGQNWGFWPDWGWQMPWNSEMNWVDAQLYANSNQAEVKLNID